VIPLPLVRDPANDAQLGRVRRAVSGKNSLRQSGESAPIAPSSVIETQFEPIGPTSMHRLP